MGLSIKTVENHLTRLSRQGLEAGAVAFLDKKDLGLSTLRQMIDEIG